MTSLRIVVVDDHAVVRRGVRALLESQPGWEVAAEATTGREAVDVVSRLQPDIVVMDLSLPELNGLDATRQILKESPGTEVLVLTMHHSEELARNVLQAGARGYLLKAEGKSNKEAASTLGISVKTIEAHRASLMRKLRLHSLSDLVRYAIRNKIVQA
jgi:DNA-binding NarL/FixJ family response regulator